MIYFIQSHKFLFFLLQTTMINEECMMRYSRNACQSDDYVQYTEQNDTQYQITCPLCGFWFRWQRDFEIHMKSNHGYVSLNTNLFRLSKKGLMFHKCNFCSYKSYKKADVEKHKRIHTNDRPFKCRFCSYSATQKVSVVSHERQHSGERAFKCKFCTYSAEQRSNLVIHEKKHCGGFIRIPNDQ